MAAQLLRAQEEGPASQISELSTDRFPPATTIRHTFSSMDQLYQVRRLLRTLLSEVEAQPEDVRTRIAKLGRMDEASFPGAP
jgi:hypothetical protein